MKFIKNRKIIIGAVVFSVFFVFIGIFLYRDYVVHAFVLNNGGGGTSSNITPSTKYVYLQGDYWIESSPTGSATAVSSSPSSSPVTVYHIITTSVTIQFTGSYSYTCNPPSSTNSYNSSTEVTTITSYSCTTPQPASCNQTKTIKYSISNDSPNQQISYSYTLCNYNASISFTVNHEYDRYQIEVGSPTSTKSFYVEEHSPLPSSAGTYGQIGYKVTVACISPATLLSYYSHCRSGYQDISALIPSSGCVASTSYCWLSFNYQSSVQYYDLQSITGGNNTCDSSISSLGNTCTSYFAVTPYTYQENLASSPNYTTPINIYFSNSYFQSSPGSFGSTSYFYSPTYSSTTDPSSIEATTNNVKLIIFSSWMQVRNGNTYSPNGYNIDNATYNGSASVTGSPFLLGGLIEYKNTLGNFLNPTSQQTAQVSILNLLYHGSSNIVSPVYDFNFFATLYCQFTSNCAGLNVYQNGVLKSNNIANSPPTTCASNNGANWYYYNSSLPLSSASAFCLNNDIVLVNGYVTISGNLQGINNLLIISSGNITIQGGVSTVDAFLMAMGKIIILN